MAAPREPVEVDETPSTQRGPSWRAVGVLGGAAGLLLVVAVVLGLVWPWPLSEAREGDRVAEATRSAPAAAERAAATILSYDYTSLDADKTAALATMTPGYKQKYSDTFDKLVRPNAGKLRAKVTAQVRASGVSNADPDRVNVLLFVNQTTVSTNNNGDPQVALNRVVMKMYRPDRTWLVDDITSY